MKTNQEFDPIVSVAMVPVWGTIVGPTTEGSHSASVFVAVADGPDEVAIGSRTAPKLFERIRRRYWHYELDLAHHPVVLRFSLPAKEEAFAFTAIVTLLWAIRNPVEVALLGIRDLKPVIWTFLNQALRGVSRQFGIEEISAAETEMRLHLEKEAGGLGFGLRLPMLAVSLQLDEDTERYLSQRIQTGREGNLAGDRHGLAERVARHEKVEAEWRSRLEQAQAEWRGELAVVIGRLEQAQAAHQRDLETAKAVHQRDMDAAQAQHTRTVEQLNTDHETKLKAQRLSFYRDALDGGNHDVMVLQLIENPGDIGSVLRLIEVGSDKHFMRSREILDELLQHQLAGASDVDALTQHTIGELRSALSAAAPHTSKVIKEGVHERVRTEERETHAERIIEETTT